MISNTSTIEDFVHHVSSVASIMTAMTASDLLKNPGNALKRIFKVTSFMFLIHDKATIDLLRNEGNVQMI